MSFCGATRSLGFELNKGLVQRTMAIIASSFVLIFPFVMREPRANNCISLCTIDNCHVYQNVIYKITVMYIRSA